MPTSRRHFLYALAGAPLISTLDRFPDSFARIRQTDAVALPPRVTNYRADKRALLVEGRTLLVAFTFPDSIGQLTGSLPVRLKPASLKSDPNNEPLIEPQPLFFYPSADKRTFRAILSAPLDCIEGRAVMNLSTSPQTQRSNSQWSFPYAAQQGIYRQSSLTLDKNFSKPSPEIVSRQRADFETMVEIYGRRTARQWQTEFVQPVPGIDRNNFGDNRVVNGTKHYRHAGLDYRAAMGTAVRAINDGVIALSAEQWTPGQTVCIDHGGGVFSKYLHLSERRAREGESVRGGQLIGLSGHSGGQKPPPHLHLDLVVSGIHVDPKNFMRTAAQLLKLEAEDRSA
jgi:murein DD-endopeptidase MepM/ murein hydrolase activator NlpD